MLQALVVCYFDALILFIMTGITVLVTGDTSPSVMTVNYRALLIWFLILAFFVLLCVRVDDKVQWNWFIVFIPLWLLDVAAFVYIMVFIIRHCVSGVDTTSRTMKEKIFFMFCVGVKMTFEILVCVRLEYVATFRAIFVAVPLWTLLTAAVVDVSRLVFQRLVMCDSVTQLSCATVVCKTD